jgi:hypothetical protein
MEKQERNLIYIGDRYYKESHTIMSSIYEESTWMRFDWGFVNTDLRNGISVRIRPANAEELGVAHQNLKEILEKYGD